MKTLENRKRERERERERKREERGKRGDPHTLNFILAVLLQQLIC